MSLILDMILISLDCHSSFEYNPWLFEYTTFQSVDYIFVLGIFYELDGCLSNSSGFHPHFYLNNHHSFRPLDVCLSHLWLFLYPGKNYPPKIHYLILFIPILQYNPIFRLHNLDWHLHCHYNYTKRGFYFTQVIRLAIVVIRIIIVIKILI